jgi:hypothetical protein
MFGAEDTGLPEIAHEAATDIVRIPVGTELDQRARAHRLDSHSRYALRSFSRCTTLSTFVPLTWLRRSGWGSVGIGSDLPAV